MSAAQGGGGDPLEETTPPNQLVRCTAHEGMTKDFGERITRVETRMDSLEQTMGNGFEQVMTRLNEGSQKFAIQNGKISKLQQWRMYIIGGIGVAVFLFYLGLEVYRVIHG